MTWHTKRVYDAPAPDDGHRVLVDRLWPRGLSKQQAHVDLWLKDVAPTAELRQWYGHRQDRFEEFTRRYTAELSTNPVVTILLDLAETHPVVTLLYAAKDPENNAAVLADHLRARSG